MVRKILYSLTMAAVLGLVIISCEDENEGQKQVQMVDVSSRITGVPAFTGAGAEIEVEGTGLTDVVRIIFDVYVVRKIEIDTTDTGISFTVPAQVGEGENEVAFIFPNNEIAYTTIMILPLQIISGFDPTNGNLGDTVELYGNNLHIVDEVAIGETAGEIVEKDTTMIRFVVPAGAVTDVIKATSGAGVAESSNIFHACETAVDDVRCFQNYCLYGDFENLGIPHGIVNGSDWPVIPKPEDGSDQGAIFLQGSGGTLSEWELIDPIGGVTDLGKTTLQCTCIQIGSEPYNIQLVFNSFLVPAGKKWLYSGKIWADGPGRVAKIIGGTDPPGGYPDMLLADGTAAPITALNEGWNMFEVEMIHDMSVSSPHDDEIRPMIYLSYPENLGAVFLFDDLRVVIIGDR